MPRRPAIVRFLDACVSGDDSRAVRILDEITPWRGLAEVAADVAGPALVRAISAQLATGREELAAGLEGLARTLRNG